jgi:hypothetical protein
LITLCGKKRTVIVADTNTVGLRGARELKAKLKNATVIVPPQGRDAREWITKHGATRSDVLELSGERRNAT